MVNVAVLRRHGLPTDGLHIAGNPQLEGFHMLTKTCATLAVPYPARRLVITAGALAIGFLAMRSSPADADDTISHSAESIHQEPSFKASRARVYEVLTDSMQFDKVAESSEAMKSMPQMKKPSEISRQAGGPFALFGGYIIGRQIELVPNELIVQAWRAGSWDRGVYSIARFELTEQGEGTKILFDHTGFPKGQAEHLALGWEAQYWGPLRRFLS
jgi:activator of HSP90 ATPase